MPCCVGNSSDDAFCCCCCDTRDCYRAGYGPTTAATTIPIVRSAEERFRQCASARQADCVTFAQCGSERSGPPGKLRLRHCQPTPAPVSHVWHADLQQFPRVSRPQETRLLLPMDGGPARCPGCAETQNS